MPSGCGDRNTECLKQFNAFCCSQKRDLLNNDNFEKTIDIFPRIIVIEKVKIHQAFTQTITIRNTGTIPRKVKFITEPNNNITFKINGQTNLLPQSHVSVELFLEPTKKKAQGMKRYFFVLAEHPDIVWEIPIIVSKTDGDLHVPDIVCLPKVPANTVSNYQFVIYNMQPMNEILFSIPSSKKDRLTVNPSSGTVLSHDYLKILITGKVPSEPTTTSLVLTTKNGKSYKILVQMGISNQLVHLSTSELVFEDTYIGLSSQKYIFVCNRSNECIAYEWSCTENMEFSSSENPNDEKLVVSDFVTLKNKRGCISPMKSALSIFTFTAIKNYQYEEEESQFLINEFAYLICPILGNQSYRVQISGRIHGPRIELQPLEIDVSDIYIGQIHCATLDVENTGPISGEIYFKNHTDKKHINCIVSPTSVYVAREAKKSIQLSFYRRDVGKFLTKLNFKIRSGEYVSILLRGISHQTKVNVLPEELDFGDIPICIPQEKTVTISNPLPVPIVVKPSIVDDGVEDPLILNVYETLNIPVNTRSGKYYENESSEELLDDENLSKMSSEASLNKHDPRIFKNSSEISSMFQKNVLDDIPTKAPEFLENLKHIHSKQKLDEGMKIIDASLDCMYYQFDYFKNVELSYMNMDWNALPNDAKEVAIEEERFYLDPNEKVVFPIALVPNTSGPNTKMLRFQICPTGRENSDIKDAIKVSYMTSTLSLNFNCLIPILEYNNNITFSQLLYVDLENTFKMNFKNIHVVSGFVHFKVIPTTTAGTIKIEKSKQKFYIQPGEKVAVACSAIFRKTGKINLIGIFNIIGKILEYTFKVDAKVLPPEVKISTEKIFEKQRVLEMTKSRVFIENVCPTIARLVFSLKYEKYQFVEPRGASLAPNQIVLVTVYSRFMDPGVYKNSLYIELKHADKQVIPITFAAEGVPVHFEPDLQNDLDYGVLFRNSKPLSHDLKISNYGEKAYKISINKIVHKKLSSKISVCNIEPKILQVEPDSQEIAHINLDLSNEIESLETFYIEAQDNEKHKFKLFSFKVKCHVTISKVIWSKNEVNYETRFDKYNDVKKFDNVSLINTTPFDATVILNVTGKFVIGEELEDMNQKALELIMLGKTSKEFYVGLNMPEVEKNNTICQCFKGSIKIKVNNKIQKSLPLHVKAISPALRICTPKIALFPPYTDSIAQVSIHNCSQLPAEFIWKEVESKLIDNSTIESSEKETFSKTISESILSMPVESFPIPTLINKTTSEEILCDFESHSSSFASSDQFLLRHFELGEEELSETSCDSIYASSISYKTAVPECRLPFLLEDQPKPLGIDDIFEYLGISDDPSSELNSKGDKNYSEIGEEPLRIVFQQPTGEIPSKSMFKAYFALPAIPNDKTLVSKYKLEVIGGETETLDLTVTSETGKILASSTDVSLGKNPWFITIMDKIRITNICQYSIKVCIVQKTKSSQTGENLTGHSFEIVSPKNFILYPKASTDIEYSATMGLCRHFYECFGIEVNNNKTAVPIKFHGQVVFPIVLPLGLKRGFPIDTVVIQNYFHLRDLFNDVQRMTKNNMTCDSDSSCSCELDEINDDTKKQSAGFVLLDYDKHFPSALDIERTIELEKFLFKVFKSNELMAKYESFLAKCERVSAMNFESFITLKLKICCPLPWEFCNFVLTIGSININEVTDFEIPLLFVGSSRLFLSVRTDAAIPGLTASFECSEKFESFVYLSEYPAGNTPKKYQNWHERLFESQRSQTEIKNLPSNSRLSATKVKKERISNANQSRDKKNPLTLAEVFQVTKEDLQDFKLKLRMQLTPSKEFYDVNQVFKDYLYIDVHLGPVIPILLQGRIIE